MVSFHKALPESPKTEAPAEFDASSKKRKWEEAITEEFFKDQTNAEKRKSIFDIDLHLETPLSSHKWQQYLNIQSGQTHLSNTRMNRKTPDSKKNPEPDQPQSFGQMSLDLELNLTCESLKKKEDSYDINEKINSGSSGSLGERDLLIGSKKYKKDSCVLTRSPSWLSSEAEHKEMIARVCMRCHMLVMLCKSSPSCPNCKFMHPPDQNPFKFFKKRRCSLLS
ncbi:uncharacterized protein LOC133285321 [Gastrolobium bilobum]|uniref:uncharacterized protein LOC133285321 n=1 Tax=Gastrolobium bilobum TaxID=150636 RepID=UPI002AB31449|nr:uncharacterized protein LOC133285321 [Gastrolobium bilobum]